MAEGTREQDDPTRFFMPVQETAGHLHINTLEPSLRDTVYGEATQGLAVYLGPLEEFIGTCLAVPCGHKGARGIGQATS